MKGKLVFAAAVLAGVAALVVVPLTAASPANPRLQIGYSLQFPAGPGHSVGTFVASGAVDDSGTASSVAGFVTPPTPGSDGRLQGTVTLVGTLGTITEEFRGIAGPFGAPHEAARGTFRIVSGTGEYASLRGEGRFLVVVDFSTGQAVRTDDGETAGGDDGGDD
jgi:hypothetical protein